MKIIDSHVHIWTHDDEYPWAAGEVDNPTTDAHPEALIELLMRNGVERAVLVQYIKYRWDNRYVARVMQDNPTLFTAVCRVDPENPNSPDELSYWTEEHGFQGVRLSPRSESQGDWFSPLLMVPLFKRAETLKIPIFVLTRHDRLKDLAQIIEKVPEVNVVLDHMADCINQPDDHLNQLLDLAKYPGVFLKVGHIPQHSSDTYPWADTHPSLERIVHYFGAERIMWGSDWPFCLNEMTYSQSLAYILEGVKFLTKAEREWLLYKTALRIWH
jgi:predicted TIM-barrel fold metal-dependent hydrolase